MNSRSLSNGILSSWTPIEFGAGIPTGANPTCSEVKESDIITWPDIIIIWSRDYANFDNPRQQNETGKEKLNSEVNLVSLPFSLSACPV